MQKMLRLGLAVVVLGLAITLSMALLQNNDEPEAAATVARTAEVTALDIAPGQYHPQWQWVGHIAARQRVEVTSPLQTEVLATPLLPGDRVSRGDTLIVLDRTELEDTLERLQLDLEQVSLTLRERQIQHNSDRDLFALEERLRAQTARDLMRAQALYDRGASSNAALEALERQLLQAEQALLQRQTQLDHFEVRSEQLRVQREQLNLQLAQAQRNLARAAMPAPAPGIIEQHWVASGQRVSVGAPLMTLYDPTSLVWRVQVPPAQDTRVQAFIAGTWQPPKRVVPQPNQPSLGPLLEFELPPQFNGRPGEVHSLRLRQPLQQPVQLIPESALYGGQQIFLINAEGRLEALNIEPLGALQSDGEAYWLIAAEALPEQGQILVSRLPNPLPGQAVEVVTQITLEVD